ncbi:DNA-directed RNA polymerase II subunit D [Pseudogymnoascus sp. 23342-1-I1]|nr:DNA-directed RNA polymerase II subunit D [Pseudogymnoascus sp. 23342-1-I1]
MSTNAAQTMRKRAPPQGDEEAGAELKLGEFQDVDALTHSEAALVISFLVAKRKADKDSKRVNDSEMLNKTLEYLDHFARFKRKENVEAVERLLSAHQELAKFERAQLGSLCCELAEEAKTLVPSLADKITDDDLQELLNEINKHRAYDG